MLKLAINYFKILINQGIYLGECTLHVIEWFIKIFQMSSPNIFTENISGKYLTYFIIIEMFVLCVIFINIPMRFLDSSSCMCSSSRSYKNFLSFSPTGLRKWLALPLFLFGWYSIIFVRLGLKNWEYSHLMCSSPRNNFCFLIFQLKGLKHKTMSAIVLV